MKKLFLMGFAALAFASCVSDKEITPLTQGEKYEKAFENLVGGTVNANVNWGFNNLQVAGFNEDGEFIGMRGVNTNANEWSNTMNVPANPTEKEIALVTEYFKTHQYLEGVAVNWSDFFVWDISSEGYGKTNMDKLLCGPDKNNLEHMNNFNAGTCSDNGWHGKSMCLKNSGTTEFVFHNSLNDTDNADYVKDHDYYDHFVIIPGEWIDPSLAGNYYVGFDYESEGTTAEKNVPRDYYYSDWIIRINPGTYKNAQRIMVEDLIAQSLDNVDISDWDFNDAVFDVAFVNEYEGGNNVTTAIITLWAAGGTQALTVAGQEVHELFGQPVSAMINTGNGVDGLAPVIFRVNLGVTDWNKTYNGNDIKVMVGSTELKAEAGKAPQKIAVPTTTKWMKERQIITKGYADFKTYATTDQPKNWYNKVTDDSVLY